MNFYLLPSPDTTGVEAGALTVAGQWRNFTAFPSILANSIIINRLIFTSGLRWVNSTNSVPESEGEPVASKVVPLIWYCKTPAGWRRLPVAFHPSGKLRPRYATVGGKLVEGKLVGGTPVEYPEGHYEVRCNVEGKRVWRNVGADARTALAEQGRMSRQLAAREAAVESCDTIADVAGRINLQTKAKAYHARQITRKKLRHAARFKREIAEFLAISGVAYADQLTEEVVLLWYDRLREGETATGPSSTNIAWSSDS
jgi:hypothetical protein